MDDIRKTSAGVPMRVLILTLDRHLEASVTRAERQLQRDIPGLTLTLVAATDWARLPGSLDRAKEAIARADIIVANMLFIEDHVKAVQAELESRADDCDAFVGILAAGEVIKCTRLGRLNMGREERGLMSLLKRLRGSKRKAKSSGAGQMAVLRRLPKILRFIPGTAQDLRSYFLSMGYWLSGSEGNIANMVRMLVNGYASGDRASLKGSLKVAPPIDYPDVGLYHPSLAKGPVAELSGLTHLKGSVRPRIGLMLMRSYILSGDCRHYDAVIGALEARGLDVVPAFASGLDARPAIDAYFKDSDGNTTIDCLVSLTGFSLVGGPAYNDTEAAQKALEALDVPYMPVHSLEFQSLSEWEANSHGLSPVEATLMVALPELEGGVNSMVFAGRDAKSEMQGATQRVDRLANRVARMVALRRKPRSDRKLAVTLFNFPPGAGSAGSAAHLSVFQSLHRSLVALKAEGYDVEVPESVDALKALFLTDASDQMSDAVIHARIPRDDHIAKEPYLADIEATWGPAPGNHNSDGQNILICGVQLGKLFIGMQPGLGIEDDPMRLLFEKDHAPTHAMSAYYRWLRDDYGADALLHFGTHGGLEFMPGKQVGMSDACWPERLIGSVPHYYLYAVNNPSEGTIAKRRSAATLISYLTPPLARAGLYKGFAHIHDLIADWGQRRVDGSSSQDDARLVELILEEAKTLELITDADLDSFTSDAAAISKIKASLSEIQDTAIPDGLHTLGQRMSAEGRRETLAIALECLLRASDSDPATNPEAVERLLGSALAGDVDRGATKALGLKREQVEGLVGLARNLTENNEIDALIEALDGGYVKPSPAGDLIHAPEILPTGRNIHGFDPFRLPTHVAMEAGERQARCLLDRLSAEQGDHARSLAFVLWGTDNIKNGGQSIAQVMALVGAKPRFDAYGRLCGASLVPLAEHGRPRVDVVLTISGIFRDLLPGQSRMLAEALWLAASAEEEDATANPIRANTLAHMEKTGCGFEEAAMRVFANADGAYGANVNRLIDSGMWEDDDELAECYGDRKCFAISRTGEVVKQRAVLDSALETVEAAYQNVDSVELGVTTIDHYFDTLGGISKAVSKARGIEKLDVYLGDQTMGGEKVRSLEQQVALETRTRTLNPKWYDAMLAHGFEGVHQIEMAVTNTLGWSATTGAVEPWVYDNIAEVYMLDDEMRRRLAELNPAASSKLTNRLREACERTYWNPDDKTREALERAADELEDRLEGISTAAPAAGSPSPVHEREMT